MKLFLKYHYFFFGLVALFLLFIHSFKFILIFKYLWMFRQKILTKKQQNQKITKQQRDIWTNSVFIFLVFIPKKTPNKMKMIRNSPSTYFPPELKYFFSVWFCFLVTTFTPKKQKTKQQKPRHFGYQTFISGIFKSIKNTHTQGTFETNQKQAKNYSGTNKKMKSQLKVKRIDFIQVVAVVLIDHLFTRKKRKINKKNDEMK